MTEVFDSEEVHVSCIGSGPGSDLVGILKLMLKKDKRSRLYSSLCDRESTWGDSWQHIERKIQEHIDLCSEFQKIDVTSREILQSDMKYLRADLFTLIFFVSEIYSFKKTPNIF